VEDSLAARIQVAADKLDITITPTVATKMAQYLGELQKWNKTYNLTALKSQEDMLVQHVFDSLAIMPELKGRALTRATPFQRVVDVGSGAGLPGAIIAMADPKMEVFCVDAVQKKSAFVAYIAGKLAIDNLHSIHGRIEQVNGLEADLVISRAFASLVDFAKLAGRHVSKLGLMASMKSRQLRADVDALNKTDMEWEVLCIDALTVPNLDAERYLVWLRRKNENDTQSDD
jgi:16S rRNA (guanine527-N7)-methyltransferase